MLQLTKTILRRPVAVIVLVAGMLIFGLGSVLGMPLQLIPDIDMPMLLIQTVYPQAGPEEVERLVTKKIEDGCGTISGLDTTTSYSMENMSMVLLQFDYGTDIDDAYADVQAAVARTKSKLPSSANDSVILKMDMNAQPVMYLAVNSLNGDEVSSFVNDYFEPEIKKLGTVAQVEISGAEDKYISVSLIPERLIQYGINITSVTTAVSSANITLPAGSKEYGNYNIDVTTKTEYKTPEEIGTIPITTGTGDIIHLSDIAIVRYANSDDSSLSRYNGSKNVSVEITKEQKASAVTVSKDVKSLIDDLKTRYPDVEIIIEYDSADSILSSIKSIFETLVFGVLITMFVLFLFFGDFKGSFIVGSSMPVSMLITFILMSLMGFSLNIVTMGAMVIAIGMMVDNSIVVIEMCFRKKEEIDDYELSAYEAVKVVVNSVIASTITTVVVYLPLSLMKGLSGQMFGQLGLTIVFALCASLVSAITVVPLCFKYYKPVEKTDAPINKILEKIANVYRKMLRKLLYKKKITAFAAIVIFAVSIFLIQFVHTELMPATDEGEVSISITYRPGTKKEVVDEKVAEIEAYVSQFDYIEGYAATSRVGSGSVDAFVDEKAKLRADEVVDMWIDEITAMADNCEIEVSTSSSSSAMGGSGNTYDITYESTDLDTLKNTVSEISDIILETNGVSNVSSTFGTMASKAEIHVDPIKAAANNLTPQMVGGSIYSAMNSSDTFDSSIDGKTYKVKVEYPKTEYETVNDVYGMTLLNTRGQEVPLRDIADMVYTDTPQRIERSNGRYVVTLTAAMKSSEKFDVQDRIEERLKDYVPPENVYKTDSMMNKMMKEEFQAIGVAIATAVLLVFMVMAIEFENLIFSILVMFCIPFAIIGSVVFLLVTGNTFSMTSLMGFMMLAGIVVNNGILFVDYANQLKEEGWETDDALVETGASRLRPILMTTLTTVISMLPFALGIGKNSEAMEGMALVICGGLIASTILTLLMIPVFFKIIDQRKEKKAGKKALRLEKKEAKKAAKKSKSDNGANKSEEVKASSEAKEDIKDKDINGKETKKESSEESNDDDSIEIVNIDDIKE